MSGSARVASHKQADLLGSRLSWLLWGVPGALFLIGIGWPSVRAWLWIPALAVAATACVANASRCGRLHCFMTGPLFAVAALATLLDAEGVVGIDWRWTLALVVAGAVSSFALEWRRGRYVGGVRAAKGSCS